MARTVNLTRQLAVRLDERTLKRLEEARDPDLYPSQSDFVREAIRRMIREERRKRIATEIGRLMQDPEEVRLQKEMANWHEEILVENWAKADRGEL